ncbi:hypothetical protein O59_003751 [Cellvibrio sp. BR]|nr:hypothetical protein O59_003751 [Cellvibrio sp. BR]
MLFLSRDMINTDTNYEKSAAGLAAAQRSDSSGKTKLSADR